MSAKVTAKVTVEIELPGDWPPESTMSEITAAAIKDATMELHNALKGSAVTAKSIKVGIVNIQSNCK
jgi:hypothetical protein